MKKSKIDQTAIELNIRHPLTRVRLAGIKDPKRGIRLTRATFLPQGRGASSPISEMPEISKLVYSFLEGKTRDLSSVSLDLSGVTPFTRDVLLAARSIPWGSVVSYAKLAHSGEAPAAVRAVASVMRKNPLPLFIPCHRVIRNNGSIGGFMGKTKGKEVELKKKLLELEKSG